MTDNEIIKALKDKINGSDYQCFEDDDVLDLIVKQRAEIKRLNYILWGVMHSVDKWLDGAELEQDEVNRAATMREKTLRIIEEKQAEIERLENEVTGLETFSILLPIKVEGSVIVVGPFGFSRFNPSCPFLISFLCI